MSSQINIHVYNTQIDWRIALSPPSRQLWTVGRYAVGDRAYGDLAELHARSLSWDCTESGQLEVLEIQYDAQTHKIQHLALNFSLTCAKAATPLRGTILYQATVGPTGEPVATPDAAHLPTATAVPVAPDIGAACGRDALLNSPATQFCVEFQSVLPDATPQVIALTEDDTRLAAFVQNGSAVSLEAGLDDRILTVVMALADQPQVLPGVYDTAIGPPFHRPYLDISFQGNYMCGPTNPSSRGHFAVREIVYEPVQHTIERIAVTFEQVCMGNMIRGFFLYQATHAPDGSALPTPDPARPPTPQPPVAPPPLAAACLDNPALQGRTTYFCASSDAEDLIGHGQSFVLTPDNGSFRADQTQGGVALELNIPEQIPWQFLFAAARDRPLDVGIYGLAAGKNNHPPGRPWLDIIHTQSCDRTNGTFQVLDLVRGPGSDAVERFAANFEQHCEGQVPAFIGSVRYQAPGTP